MSFLFQVLLYLCCLCFDLQFCILPVPSTLEGDARRQGEAPRGFVSLSKEQILEVTAGRLGLCSLIGFGPEPQVTSMHLLLLLKFLTVSYGAYSSFLSDVWLLLLKLSNNPMNYVHFLAFSPRRQICNMFLAQKKVQSATLWLGHHHY